MDSIGLNLAATEKLLAARSTPRHLGGSGPQGLPSKHWRVSDFRFQVRLRGYALANGIGIPTG